MNSNKTDEGPKLANKPLVMNTRNTPMRTVSANPTLSEPTNNNQGTDKDGVKLNTNAPAFVPKDKRSMQDSSPLTQKVENKENITQTTTGNIYTQPQSYVGGGYQMNMQQGNPQKPTYLYSTYLNPINPQPMMYPMGPQVGYSPNTRTGTFFPPMTTNMQMGYPNYMPPYQQKTPYGGITQPMTAPLTTPTPQTTTTTTLTPITDKKITFSKDSKIFIPKAMRTHDVNERKSSENVEVVENIQKEKVPELIQEETKPEITSKTASVNEVPELVTEQKRANKLTDFLNAPVEKKPALAAAKKVDANKKVITTPLQTTPKGIDKTLEEKRKQLINLQKQEKVKPALVVSPPIRKRDLTPEEVIKSSKESSGVPSDDEEDLDEIKATPPTLKTNLKLERNYFLVDENKPRSTNNIYSVDYILSFKNWKICEETKLLDKLLLDHIEAMNIYEDERPRGYKADKRKSQIKESQGTFQKATVQPVRESADKPSFSRSTIKLEQPQLDMGAMDLLKWGRKDITSIEKEAVEFRQKFDEVRKLDPLKNELTESLNLLTVDNYEEVKRIIFDLVKDSVESQIKLLEVLFKKAIAERSFVTLYAKLCKDLDRDVPQRSEKETRTSQMRSELLNKCREVFKVDNAKISQYVNIDNVEERENKLKKFLLGNVNFIGELINAKLLSKKIVFQCINNLFQRVEKFEDEIIKQINLEGIVILMDKFGTLINKHDHKAKVEEIQEYNNRIDEYLNKLDEIQQNDKSLPGHVRYKIINLIEKRNRGWEESKVDKTKTAKGIKEVREEHENEQRVQSGRGGSSKLDQDTVNNKIKGDMYNYRSHIKDGFAAEEYQWDTVDVLIKKHKNTLAEILTAFGETCIDFVGKEDDIQYAYLYFRDIITYYSQKLERKERNELVDVTLYFLQILSDLCLDNQLLVDVWGGVIYLLEFCSIFRFQDLDNLKDIQEDQLKTIFEVINTALGYYEKKEDKIKELSNLNLVKNNKSLFSSIVTVSEN